MTALRSRIYDAALALWLAVFALPIPLMWLMGRPPRLVRLGARTWGRGVLLLLNLIVGLRYREHDRALLPKRPCLIICNHQAVWEALAALVLFPDVAIVTKRELLKIPVLGWYIRHSPMIVIDRDSGTAALRQMIVEATDALAANRHVLIFPEGTRKGADEEIEFKRGVELLYKALKVEVAPVLVNSGEFWDLASGCKRAGVVDVTYLPPIPPNLSMAEFTRLGEERMRARNARQDAPPSDGALIEGGRTATSII